MRTIPHTKWTSQRSRRLRDQRVARLREFVDEHYREGAARGNMGEMFDILVDLLHLATWAAEVDKVALDCELFLATALKAQTAERTESP